GSRVPGLVEPFGVVAPGSHEPRPELSVIVFEREAFRRLSCAHPFQRFVDGDTSEPRRKTCVALKGRQMLIRLEKGDLCDVLRVFHLAGHTECRPIDSTMMTPHQLLERSSIALHGPGHEPGVRV